MGAFKHSTAIILFPKQRYKFQKTHFFSHKEGPGLLYMHIKPTKYRLIFYTSCNDDGTTHHSSLPTAVVRTIFFFKKEIPHWANIEVIY